MIYHQHNIYFYVHWNTLRRQAFILPHFSELLFARIHNQLVQQDCPVVIVNGSRNSVHCIFSLNPSKSLAEVMQNTKGIVSHFVNEQNLLNEKFAWEKGYHAFSLSGFRVKKLLYHIQQISSHSENLFDFTAFV
jgi:REP element-mobilizing transposase RayT